MYRRSILLLALLLITGCTSVALERSTLNQIQTLSDLRLQVTMDNLAVFADNPSALPFYIVVSAGTTEVIDEVSIADMFTWGGGAPSTNELNPGANRTWQQNWTLDPVHDPETLEAMRCAFRWVFDLPEAKCENCLSALHKFQVLDKLARIPPGWFHVGRKHDLPKNACYSSCCHGTYVWVTADGLEALTQLTLILIDMAMTDTNSLDPPVTVSKTIEYEKDQKTVKTCTVNTQEVVPKSSAPLLCCGEPPISPQMTGPGSYGAISMPRPMKFRIRYQGASDPVLRGLINLRNR